ncbi:hypothetical protein BH10ACT10_BH10ACT10_05560 [soil metagenome]
MKTSSVATMYGVWARPSWPVTKNAPSPTLTRRASEVVNPLSVRIVGE